jgi:hypothetical protein
MPVDIWDLSGTDGRPNAERLLEHLREFANGGGSSCRCRSISISSGMGRAISSCSSELLLEDADHVDARRRAVGLPPPEQDIRYHLWSAGRCAESSCILDDAPWWLRGTGALAGSVAYVGLGFLAGLPLQSTAAELRRHRPHRDGPSVSPLR